MMKDWLNIHLFHAFFQELRRLGMELDLRQYELLLQALRLGIGADENGRYTEQAFLDLCKLLWLTHPRYEPGFEDAFGRWIGRAKEAWAFQPEERREPAGKSPEDSPRPSVPTLIDEPAGDSPGALLPPPPPSAPAALPPPSATKQQEWEVSFEAIAGQTKTMGFAESEPVQHRFIYADHYLPFSPRQLQQQCRHLRYKAEKRPGDAIDAGATMQATAEAAGFPQLCYAAERYFTGAFVVFIDRGDGMAAFDKLADAFVRSLRAGLGMAAPTPAFRAYYFNEVPRQLVYMDSLLSVSKPWVMVQRQLTADSQVFILSDAGAASPRQDRARDERILDWVQEIQQKTRHLLWLNPMPRTRWPGRAAHAVPLLADCLPLMPENMPQLPGLLRHL